MGHIQGPTPIQFENILANVITNDTVVQCRSKAMDVRFYWFVINSDKNSFMFIEKSKTQSCQLSIKTSLQFDLPMYSIPSKNKQKIYLNYQWHCKGVFKHIFRQPLSNRWITNLQFHQWPLHQFRTNDVGLHDTFLPFQDRLSKPVSLNQRRYLNVVLSKTNKYAVRRKSVFYIVSDEYNQHSNSIFYVRFYLGFNVLLRYMF